MPEELWTSQDTSDNDYITFRVQFAQDPTNSAQDIETALAEALARLQAQRNRHVT